MKWYPWLRPHFEQLITSHQIGRGHHAVLIQSLPGTGDDALIYAITCFILCQYPKKKDKSCGKCRSCQLMQSGNHPDCHILKLKNSNTTFGVDIIRYLNKKLYEHAYLDGLKIVWLNNAALLTEVASNALLKILEEPPEKTCFFISCHNLWRVLATLRSRCCLHYLTVPQERWALSWLQKEIAVLQDAALTALRLCRGAPIAALELLQKNHWTQRAQLCLALGNSLKNCDWLSLLTILNHKQASTRLYWLITLLIDALKLQYGMTTITNVDVCSLVSNIAEIMTNTTLHAIIYTLCQCHKQLLTVTGLNQELILIDQLLTIENYLQLGVVPSTPQI